MNSLNYIQHINIFQPSPSASVPHTHTGIPISMADSDDPKEIRKSMNIESFLVPKQRSLIGGIAHCDDDAG